MPMLQQAMVAAAAVLVVAAMGLQPSSAADRDLGRIAIIDTSKNTRAYLDALATAGVRVIGRYYARCPQPGLEEKRLVGNAGEIDAILSHPARFGVLSIYQYYNNSALKLAGKRETTCRLGNGKTKKTTVTLADENCLERALDSDCKEADGPPHTLAMEAKLDADAAVRQARQARQPAGTDLLRRRFQCRHRHRAGPCSGISGPSADLKARLSGGRVWQRCRP
jgi:hypothetical protein